MQEPLLALFPEPLPRPSVISATKGEMYGSDQPSSRYINRELSWLRFNRRVLAEALDERLPILERIRFLSIFGSNLDEFFMIRVSGLRTQMATAASERSTDGLNPAEQLAAIRHGLLPTLERCTVAWTDELLPELRKAGIHVLRYSELKRKQRQLLRRHFIDNIFPVLTPLAFDPGHPFPHISNLSINLAVVVKGANGSEKFARLRAPSQPRLVRIPDEEQAEVYEQLGLQNIAEPNFVWLEEVVAANLDLLFPKMDGLAAYPFRVTRDADLEIEEDEAADLLTAISHVVERRHFSRVVRLEIDGAMPDHIREILTRNLELAPYQVYATAGPIGLADLSQLAALELPSQKYPPFSGFRLNGQKEGIFERISRGDLILHHPYDSFDTVLEFLAAAAKDPDVVAIKQTLYRVGPASPIVKLLEEARENDKQVAALVELKARFDEENNIVWAKELEDAGVHVAYGVVGLKTHAKMALVVRRENSGIRLYAHLGTGNYNQVTGRTYTDIGLLTCNPEITRDVLDLFNGLTGYSAKTNYSSILVSPASLRAAFLSRIDREIEKQSNHGNGHIAWKCNGLTDEPIIDALYRASQAGVKIDLIVRGVCCLRPKMPGVSDNVTVRSVLGRFLEHERVYYFANGGDEEIFIGSADMMQRNFDSRVEVLVPIKDPNLRAEVRDSILGVSLRDNVRSWELLADGSYEKKPPAAGEEAFDSQQHSMDAAAARRDP